MTNDRIVLPMPAALTGLLLSEALERRRSIRRFAPGGLCLEDLSALLFAAQGRTHAKGFRTAPSAGALYPLEVCVAAGECSDLACGMYGYDPGGHALVKRVDGDRRGDLAAACLNQAWMAQAQAMVVISAVYDRITGRYGERGVQYAHMEAGAASQNLALAAAAMGLGTVMVGAFRNSMVLQIIGAAEDETPLIVMPVGRTARAYSKV